MTWQAIQCGVREEDTAKHEVGAIATDMVQLLVQPTPPSHEVTWQYRC
jgi:hypothetical protein